MRPRGGGWGQAERVRNQIGGVELCRSDPGRNRRSLAEQDQGRLDELRGGAELIVGRRGVKLSQSGIDERGSTKKGGAKTRGDPGCWPFLARAGR